MNAATCQKFEIRAVANGNTSTIHVDGHFCFASYRCFSDTCTYILNKPDVADIAIDLTNVHYMDTAALGMLLILRDRTQSGGKSLTLVNPSVYANNVFDVTNFRTQFNIEMSHP